MKVFKRIMMVIIIVILVILVVLGICLTRKHMILKNISKKLAECKKLDNYYIKETLNNNVIEYYVLGDVTVEKDTFKDSNRANQSVTSYYRNGEKHTYITSGTTKLASYLDSENVYDGYFFNENFWKTEGTLDYIKMLWKLKISDKTFDGKKCYYMDFNDCKENLNTMILENGDDTKDMEYGVYVEKSTDMVIGTSLNPELILEYKFDCVTEDDVTEPDKTEFELKNNY